MKLGLDFHGVITHDTKFFLELIKRLNPDEIHVMTGARKQTFQKEVNNIKYNGLQFTHFFSISDHIKENYPDKIDLSTPNHPKVEDKKLWDSQKGIYAKKHSIDLTIDDTLGYGKYFTTPFMLWVKNKK